MAVKDNLQLLRKKIIESRSKTESMTTIVNEVDKYFDQFTTQAKQGANTTIGDYLTELEGHVADVRTVYDATEELADDLQPPVIMPDVVGMTQANAEAAISGAGWTVSPVVQQKSSLETPGTVIRQFPAPGTKWSRSEPVTITVAIV